MEMTRDGKGLESAIREMYAYLFVVEKTGEIVRGWYSKPAWVPYSRGIICLSVSDYEKITSPVKKEITPVTVEDMNDAVDYRKLLGIINLDVDNFG